MDIHKPKPFHGLREFLKEYGIIVLGVLTALAAEQVVETLHERHEAAEARENIKDELATNLANLANRDAIEACIGRRLDEISATIRTAGHGAFTPPHWIGRPHYWPMFDAKWRAATSAGRATLLSADEQARYGQLYYSLELLGGVEPQEQIAWARLRMLEDTPEPTPGLLTEVQVALADARLADFQVEVFTARSRALARELNLPRRVAQHPGQNGVCLPMSTPRTVALAHTATQSDIQVSEP